MLSLALAAVGRIFEESNFNPALVNNLIPFDKADNNKRVSQLYTPSPTASAQQAALSTAAIQQGQIYELPTLESNLSAFFLPVTMMSLALM